MSADEYELSERLRKRVAALYDPQLEAAEPLREDAQRRVVQRLLGDAMRIPQQRRMRRLAGLGIGPGLLATAAALLLMLRPAPKVLPPTAAARAASSTPTCGLPLLSAAQPLEMLADGRRALALGNYGQLIVGASAALRVERSSACELAVRLAHGELAADLRSLRPARLSVLTEQGDVVVTGTRFSVRSGDDFEVVLASGVVDVVFADRTSLRLQPGTRLHKPGRAQGAQTRHWTAEDQQRLLGFLNGPPARSPEPTLGSEAVPSESAQVPGRPARTTNPSAASMLDLAEAARRAGRHAEARDAYRAASQRRDDNAEIALLRWVRLELDVGDPTAALRVLLLHTKRFAHGRLGAEAGWLEVQVRQALHQPRLALSAARNLSTQHAGTPQAAAAARMLGAP